MPLLCLSAHSKSQGWGEILIGLGQRKTLGYPEVQASETDDFQCPKAALTLIKTKHCISPLSLYFQRSLLYMWLLGPGLCLSYEESGFDVLFMNGRDFSRNSDVIESQAILKLQSSSDINYSFSPGNSGNCVGGMVQFSNKVLTEIFAGIFHQNTWQLNLSKPIYLCSVYVLAES